MIVENQILDAVIQDHKARTVLGHTVFGDIFFKEDIGLGKDLFFVCQVLPPTRPSENPAKKGEFMFNVQVVATSKNEFKGFVKSGIYGMFKIVGSQQHRELYDDITLRRGLRETLKKKLGKLGADEVYGYCDEDDYNSTNPHATKVKIQLYLEEVLVFAREHPRIYYTDIYDLARHNTPKDFVLKNYLGYGFELPEELFDTVQLKSLAIYRQSVQSLTAEKLLNLENLNALALDNVGSLSQKVLDSVHELPYLVDLSLSVTDKYIDREIFTQIPKQLGSLKSLQYFCFAGNKLDNWSEIIRLKNLRVLDVSDCGLDVISEDINQLISLEELNLSNNNIKHIPEALFQLKNLKVLRLSENQLAEVPAEICELQNLEIVDLTQTGLTKLPKEVSALPKLKQLRLKKNPFVSLPKSLLKLPKKILKIELRNQALYDAKAKAKLETYPKGNIKFENDFNFKLMVINELMYVDKILVPKFDINEFAQNYKARKIDIEEEGYSPINEAIDYFRNLEIPMDLLIDIRELKSDGGDEIYRQIIPFWDGEDEQFNVKSIADIQYLPNLRATNTMNFSKELVKELRTNKIKVSNY